MPIVAETEQVLSRRNILFKSRAQIFDGSARRFFVGRRKNYRIQRVAIAWNYRVGVRKQLQHSHIFRIYYDGSGDPNMSGAAAREGASTGAPGAAPERPRL